MHKSILSAAAFLMAISASASWYWPFEETPETEAEPAKEAEAVDESSSSFRWYWPFGSQEESVTTNGVDGAEAEGVRKSPRLSELMAPASELIEEASGLAADGKVEESVAKYREAVKELDRIESEDPVRAKKPEFATLRTKRAYVNATIDALLMEQVRESAKPIAVSDTEALEKMLAAERAEKAQKKADEQKSKAEKAEAKKPEVKEKKVEEPEVAKTETAKPDNPQPSNPRQQVIADLARGDYAAAALLIEEMLIKRPNDVKALNLRAAMEAAQGKFREAERTLDQAIQSNPRNHYAYYNMAELILRANPANRTSARRYYESGRALGGPIDKVLEEALQ